MTLSRENAWDSQLSGNERNILCSALFASLKLFKGLSLQHQKLRQISDYSQTSLRGAEQFLHWCNGEWHVCLSDAGSPHVTEGSSCSTEGKHGYSHTAMQRCGRALRCQRSRGQSCDLLIYRETGFLNILLIQHPWKFRLCLIAKHMNRNIVRKEKRPLLVSAGVCWSAKRTAVVFSWNLLP